jgi:uncharacterized protein (TIGR03067 family)
MRQDGLVWLALALLLLGGVRADQKDLALLLGGVRADEEEGDKAEAVKQEWGKLNGTWEVVRSTSDGEEVSLPRKVKLALTLKDGKYTFRQGDEVIEEGTVKIDPTTTPKSMEISAATGPDKGKTFRSIYEVKGDTQRVCEAPPGKPRPKAFGAKEGSGHTLITYKRVKARD